MPQPRFRSDRATMLAVAALLAAAAAAVLVAAAHTDATAAARGVAGLLAAAAVGLFGWAALGRRADARRRGALDRTVDDEMGRKWEPGFAATVGAFDKPWYVLCGEPGVGKTAALRAGRLPMALGPDGRPVTDAEQGKQGTYLFDWWFFEDAVVLDSAGDLIAQADDRWAAFLGRIRDARPDRPVNGMLLAISAADLITAGEDALREKAALLAKQVRVARGVLRVRFPLYLLVTKADLIPGFADFFPAGSDLKSSFQILGWSDGRDPRRDDAPVTPADVRRGLESVVADLRRRRTAVEARATSGRDDARSRLEHADELFAFPAAAAAAFDNLAPFVAGLLEQVNLPDGGRPVPPPFFRGVYLTSALRTGEALDAELAKAFGTDLRPTARRAASDRAFFLRDLLLEKVVPEAGMVAPLTAVPAAAGRRSRLIATAAAAAAAVVLATTAVGYRRTVARARSDRDFWDGLAAVPAGQLPARLSLFGPTGTYRGGAAFDGRTVLATFERSNRLAATDTASPLLPASASLNRDRTAAHADLFRELALIPALVPGPFDPRAGPSEAATAAVLAVLTDTRGPRPASVDRLRADAAALVPLRADAADRSRVLAVLAQGTPGSAGVALSAAQQERVADAAVAWVRADLAARRRFTSAAVDRAASTVADAAALAGLLDAFERAVGQAGSPEDLVEPVRLFDRSMAAHPAAGDAAAVDPKAIAAAVAPPPELRTIGAAITRLGEADADVRRELAAVVLAHNDFLAAQAAAAATGSRAVDPMARPVREHLHPVDAAGTPRVVARAQWFRTAAEWARDAVATTTAHVRPSRSVPPAVALPPVLQELADDAAARRHSFDPLSAVDTPADRDADAAAAAHLFDLTDHAARDAVWTVATPPAGSAPWPVDPPTAAALSSWISAQTAVEGAVAADPPTRAAPARAWVAASHAGLEQVAAARLAAWEADAGRQVGPAVSSWSDVAVVVGPSAHPTADLAARVQGDRSAVAVVRRQDLFPSVKADAQAWATALDASLSPAAAAHVDAVRAFLLDHGFGRDTVDAVRAGLVADPGSLAAVTRLSGGSSGTAVEAYWDGALTRSVGLLSDAARRQTLAVLADVRAEVAGQYPLTADGGNGWDGSVSPRLAAGLALSLAANSDNPMVRQIQGLDVLTPAWRDYLTGLRGVVAFARHRPSAWTVAVRPAAGGTDADWAAVAAGPAALGEPGNWHPFAQHRVVAVTWPMVVGGVAVRLSRDPADPAGHTVAALPDLARPWAAYRLAVGSGAAVDDVAHVRVTLDRHGDPAAAVVPGVVPASP